MFGPTTPVVWPPKAAPEPAPAPPSPPAGERPTPGPLTAEERRAQAEAKKAAALWKKSRKLARSARFWTAFVIVISTLITIFGSGNAHDVLAHHNTPEPWGWFLYPALEAALIVEIQIGSALAEQDEQVVFWGAALRSVTAICAITLCVYGPAENGDTGGAFLHSIGPTVQFVLAEFLASARRGFKRSVEKVVAQAEGRAMAADRRTETRTEHPKKRTKKSSSAPRPAADGRTSPADGPRLPTPPGPSTEADDDLLVRAREAADELQRTDQRLNRDNLVRAIRAGGGTIQNSEAGPILTQLRAERGTPDLHPVRRKEA